MAADRLAPPPRAALSVESIVAVDAPREFRLHPRDRIVAYVAEAAGARQLFTLEPARWPPDPADRVREGRLRSAVVARWASARVRPRRRDLGRRGGRVAIDPGRRQARRRDLAALVAGRRAPGVPVAPARLVAALGHRRAGPAPRPAGPRPEGTGRDRRHRDRPRRRVLRVGAGWDAARGDGPPRSRPTRSRRRSRSSTSRRGALEIVAGTDGCATGGRWLPDGSLLYVSDESGWFQVVRRSPDGRDRIVLTEGEREHGEPGGGFGHVPLASPDGTRFVHIEVHDGFQDLVVASMAAEAAPKRGRGRPPKSPRTVAAAGRGQRIDPFDGVWRAIGWLADGAWIAAIGESETRPQDLWLLPVPGVAPEDARPRQVTDSLPAVLRPALAPGRAAHTERFAFTARDGLRIEGTVHRPVAADGKRGSRRVPVVIYPHGGPTGADVPAVRRRSSNCSSRRATPSSTSTSAARPATAARSARPTTTSGATPTSTTSSMAARWAAEQPWADGRLAIYGGSYGGYVVLCALVEEPAMWSAGVDLFGDSEIAESYPARRSAGPAGPAPDDGLARRRARGPPRSAAARRSIARSASRPRCSCSTAGRTSASCRS